MKFKARTKTTLTRSKSNRHDQAQEGTLDYLKKPKPDTTTKLDFSKSIRGLGAIKPLLELENPLKSLTDFAFKFDFQANNNIS
jgi:hypothetical protein